MDFILFFPIATNTKSGTVVRLDKTVGIYPVGQKFVEDKIKFFEGLNRLTNITGQKKAETLIELSTGHAYLTNVKIGTIQKRISKITGLNPIGGEEDGKSIGENF